jgi:hypothetical protein
MDIETDLDNRLTRLETLATCVAKLLVKIEEERKDIPTLCIPSQNKAFLVTDIDEQEMPSNVEMTVEDILEFYDSNMSDKVEADLENIRIGEIAYIVGWRVVRIR